MIHAEVKQQKSIVLQNNFSSILEKFIEEKHISKPFIPGIVDDRFIKNNPPYYTYYPYLFSNAFHVFDKDILNDLSIAGFLYYKAVIVLDQIFDNKQSKGTFENYLISDICKEESIKLLSDLFSSSDLFWKSWNLRKLEYIKAFEIDQKSHSIQSYEDYEQLADFKCAFGKVAIDALFHLSGLKDKKAYKDVLASHKLYYAAFQIEDDIKDFQEDIENGQFNIALFELEKKISKEEVQKGSINDLKKLLYLENIVDNLYEKALGYLRQASKIIDGYNLNEWKFELQKSHNTVTIHQLNVKGFIKVFNTRNDLSVNNKMYTQSIQEALSHGFNFIKNSQDTNGNWNDFFNDAGLSDIWSTGYIMFNIIKDASNFTDNHIAKAAEFLKKHKNPDHLWGYNSNWISDADSSTFVMLGLLNNGVDIPEKTLKSWYSYQKNDGGFSTYNDKNKVIASLNSDDISNVDGWVQSHFCVSAAAYLLFCKAGIKDSNFDSLRTYLLYKLQTSTGRLSYWWTNDIYSLNLLVKGGELIKDQELLKVVFSLVEEYMNQNLHKKLIHQEHYFYLGLLLDSLSNSKYLSSKYYQQSNEISKAILSNQLDDGSWKESYALRIPYPAILNPDSEEIIWKNGDSGTNIIFSDFHRLYTTVTCLAALNRFQSNTSLKNRKIEKMQSYAF